MAQEWVFFQDIQGLWQWTRYDRLGLVADESQQGFESVEECTHDAKRRGFVPAAGAPFPSAPPKNSH
jgi:hypothetical protein